MEAIRRQGSEGGRKVDVLIVGAGFAGAATAYHLSRSGAGSIAIVEREKTPGAHASGRNASLLLQSVADPDLRRATAASRAAYLDHRAAIGFQELGSVLLGTHRQIEEVREVDLVPSRRLTAEEVTRLVPPLAGHCFEAALLTPGDGVIDTWALLNLYLDGARSRGVELSTDCEVLGVTGGPPFAVRTSQGSFEAAVLVNAAGAWASRIAEMAGVEAAPLVPKKRHLFVLDGVGPVDPAWPFAWDLDREFYFRPESGGVLFSICDEETGTGSLEPTVSPAISEALAQRVLAHLPAFEAARIRRVWSCFRTFAEDERFTIGWDPVQEGFFWAAGLGGHGMGCSWEAGRLAAVAFSGGTTGAFDPARSLAALG